MEEKQSMKNPHPQSNLPPGFRFHPTDEELILHYLRNKVTSMPLPVSIIAEVDIYKFDPWDLPAKAAFGEKEWYFFSPRDRKYPNGARPNRSAASGYWKATGTDKTIIASPAAPIGAGGLHNIGVKKALVFYKGRPPKGVKTNWIMHEYRLAHSPANKPTILKDSSMRLDNWVLCRIYKKANIASPTVGILSDQEQEEQFIQETLLPSLRSLPDGLDDKSLQPQKSCSFSNLFDAMDYSMLSSFLDNPMGFETSPTFNTSVHALSQPFYNDCNNNNNYNNLFQKLPQLSPSVPTPSTENGLKRRFMNGDDEQDTLNSSKKYVSCCSFLNSNVQPEVPQNLVNLPYLNPKLLAIPEVQFQG